jgi:hypothetical protein
MHASKITVHSQEDLRLEEQTPKYRTGLYTFLHLFLDSLYSIEHILPRLNSIDSSHR